jgi:hypothetical protein
MCVTPRQEIMVAAMAAGSSDSEVTPVQAQKLFFLIDQNVAVDLGGPQYNFKAYDYGPFDSAVYADLDSLALPEQGMVEIVRNERYRTYRLTERGRQFGTAKLSQLDPRVKDYFARAKDWVKSLSFQELIRAIYQAYPAMRANSIFRE